MALPGDLHHEASTDGGCQCGKIRYAITDEPQLVYACHCTTGRICCGLEISPAYVDVVLKRWQAFTGRTAIHQVSGQSFDERADDRDRARP
jgi:hypothetical protein